MIDIETKSEWARCFMHAVDTAPLEELRTRLTGDVAFRMANLPATSGVEPLLAAFNAARRRFDSIRHEILSVSCGGADGNIVCVEAIAIYEMDGRSIRLPVVSLLRLREELVCDYRIYMDPAPAFA